MRSGVIALKVGMTRVYTDAGENVPVTVLKLDNCQVVAHRTVDKNGYTALQLGAKNAKRPVELEIPITIAGMSFGALSAHANNQSGEMTWRKNPRMAAYIALQKSSARAKLRGNKRSKTL